MEDEIKETREHLWGSISNKIDKIEEEADRIGWNSIIDMVADAFTDGNEMEPLELFLYLYQFMFRLLYRLKAMEKPEPFNQISTTTRLIDHEDKEFYMIKNFDYRMFKWAIRKNFAYYMTNLWFLVPIDELSASEKHNFEKRMEEQNGKETRD